MQGLISKCSFVIGDSLENEMMCKVRIFLICIYIYRISILMACCRKCQLVLKIKLLSNIKKK